MEFEIINEDTGPKPEPHYLDRVQAVLTLRLLFPEMGLEEAVAIYKKALQEGRIRNV